MDKLPPLSKKKTTIASLPPLTPRPITPSPVYKKKIVKKVPKDKTTISSLPPLSKTYVITGIRKEVLSGVRDVDLMILSELDDKDLFNFCKNFESKNIYINKLCSNENFWKNRFIQKYGEADKNPDRSWKRFYLKVTYYDDKFNDIEKIKQTKEEILKEKSDIINFFSNYLGMKALRNFLNNLDSFDAFDIYTGFKNAPVKWDQSFQVYEDYIRNYPYFPGKPNISKPMTRVEYSEFIEALEKHFNVNFANDILTIERKGDKFELTSESMSDEEIDKGGLLLTKKELIDIIDEATKYYRVEILDIRGRDGSGKKYDFDLRDYLADDI